MKLEWDIEWLADLASLTPDGPGELLLVHDEPTSPLPLPLDNGLSVRAIGIAELPTLRVTGAVFAYFARTSPAPAEFAKRLAKISPGPVVVRLAGAVPDTRELWDRAFLANGFRRHPLVLSGSPFLSLEAECGSCLLAYLPQSEHEGLEFPESFLAIERNLHMDMLREAGRRSDAHLARYTWAAEHIRPNDIVIDAACGLGYGSAILACGTRCRSVHGFDNSEIALRYANEVYGRQFSRLSFTRHELDRALPFADASVDCVVSFETLEHLENPEFFAEEARRVLKPGGRFLCSVPNRWIDETGRDPSPYHCQVFDLRKLAELCLGFRVDQAVAQCAGGSDPRFSKRRRFEVFNRLPADAEPATAGVEWWLLSAMKDPVEASSIPYAESVFPALNLPRAARLQFQAGYRDPWLAHSLVHSLFRIRSPYTLAEEAHKVVMSSRVGSADRGAALSVLAYQLLARGPADPTAAGKLLVLIRDQLAATASAPHEHRWKISLSCAAGRLLLSAGRRVDARIQFEECAALDFRAFSPHIATKTTEAAFLAGKLAYLDGDKEGAARAWNRGIEIGQVLRTVDLDDVLIAPDAPHVFGIGDGMRELTLAWDNITRCANGLHVLAELRDLGQGRFSDLEKSWQQAEATNQHFLHTISEQSKYVRQLESMHAEAEERFADERTTAAEAARMAQKYIDALRTQLDQLAATSGEQAKHIKVLEVERDRLTAETKAAETEANRAFKDGQEHIDALTAQLNQLAATSVEQTKHIKVLEAERDRLTAQTEAAQTEAIRAYKDGQKHIEALTGQLTQLAATCGEQTNYIKALETERDRLAAECVRVLELVRDSNSGPSR